MRGWPDTGFGTTNYPEKVARRLRALNVTTWLAACITLVFMFVRLADPRPEIWPLVWVNLVATFAFASVPVLHRFGARASPLVFITLTLAYVALVLWLNGTSGNAWLYYVCVAPLAALLLGTERTILAAGFGFFAVVLSIAALLVLPASTGLASPTALFWGAGVVNIVGSTTILFATVHYALRQVTRAEAEAERERLLSDALLASILPASVAERLRAEPGARVADRFDEVSVLFADMAGYTARAAAMPPAELVGLLDTVFGAFDAIVERHGLEKIKTSGDSYLVVSGLPVPRRDHAGALVRFALDVCDTAMTLHDAQGRVVPFRIGIASGPVVAGVVGSRRFFYDVWGDTVNMAARMEETGEPGRIQIAASTRALLGGGFALSARGPVAVHGKGEVETWFVEGLSEEPSL